jgi:DNA polymerase-3 subunit gamma/tau
VGPAADLPDLSASESAEIKEIIKPVGQSDLQRHLSILLKAESEMAGSTFPRLILEMALLKMAGLTPAVPVNEILERLKALERSAPPHYGSRSGSSPPPPAPRRSPGAPGQDKGGSSPATVEDKQPDPAPPPLPSAGSAGDGTDLWQGFVTFIKGKKPLLASLLEHGRPLKVSPDCLEIAFIEGSFQLNSLRDQKALGELKDLAGAFFRSEPSLRLVPLSDAPADAPSTLIEKKNLDEANRVREMERSAKGHPMVIAALEIFGGEIEEIKEEE